MRLPDDNGHFGEYGGRYISETLMPAVIELEKFYKKIRNDKDFIKDFKYYLKNYVGRPSPMALLPPPTQAIKISGSLFSCFNTSLPMTD